MVRPASPLAGPRPALTAQPPSPAPPSAAADRVVVIGAGMGGLAAAIELAAAGLAVTLVEQAAAPGGKMREVTVGGRPLDAGPTVFTLRGVFDEIFAAAGTTLEDHVRLGEASVLARHAWDSPDRLDLHADRARAADAIAAFAGPAEGRRYLDFCARARGIHDTLDRSFMRAPRPGPIGLTRRVGLHRPAALWRITPFQTMWRALGRHFHDPRLRQLFARYATYCGSSPFLAPATLMLVAHVEQEGVWLVEGGMHRLAVAMARVAQSQGARLRFGARAAAIERGRDGRVSGVVLADGERLAADHVVVNGDVAALGRGLFGPAVARAAPRVPRRARSLSAVTWLMQADTHGFPLARHTVFFGDAYAGEFEEIFAQGRLPSQPTVYVCAQDRGDAGPADTPPGDGERLLMLVNAPAVGDARRFDEEEICQCQDRMFERFARCGLTVRPRPGASTVATPADFDRLFPATGGALYGRASHGWMASFQRPGSATRVAGLYLAGGSAHPGPGVPMAALSGRLAAARLLADRASMRRSSRVAMSGGMSTR